MVTTRSVSLFSRHTVGIQVNWQELKESIAYYISSFSSTLKQLQEIHARTIYLGLNYNLYLCSLFITHYSSFEQLQSARYIFDDARIHTRTKTLLWNSMIRGYSMKNQPRSALEVYIEMTQFQGKCNPDNQTFHLAITACTDLSEFQMGSEIHTHAKRMGFECDKFVGTALIDMYCKSGNLFSARELFDKMPAKDIVSWNVMLAGYSREGWLNEALNLFHNMRLDRFILPTESTMVSLISIYSYGGLLKDGITVHCHIIKSGFEMYRFVCNSMIEMYVKGGYMNFALRLFDEMVFKDDVSWSTIIGGYVKNGSPSDALAFFQQMITTTTILPTRPILLNLLLACASLGDARSGKWIEDKYIRTQEYRFESDVSLRTSLIYMYAKCGRIDDSLKILEEISTRQDAIPWNAMMKAYIDVGQAYKAMELFITMRRKNIYPDIATYLMILPLCSSNILPRYGMAIHGCIFKTGNMREKSVGNILLDMYAKFGRTRDSRLVFDEILEKDVVSWSSIIKGYAWNSDGSEALNLFQLMKETDIRPNSITFIAVLSACSHLGFVEKGKEIFESMKDEYGIEPSIEHYSCMIDLFCRAGMLLEAKHMIESVTPETCKSASTLWGILLSACRMKGDWKIGEEAARHLFYLEPRNTANYMLLANIYVLVGRREDANRVLRLLREKGLMKPPGYSRVVDGEISFSSTVPITNS